MKKRIPVVESIGFAYNFAFGELGTILGLTWLPVVLWALGNYFVLSLYYSAQIDAIKLGQPFAMGRPILAAVAWYFGALLLTSVINVSLVRQALGLRKGQAFVHFAIGAAELRAFAAIVGAMSLFVVSYFILVVAALIGIVAQKGHPGPLAGIVLGLLAGVCALIYLLVRLTFFIVPVAVVEGEIGLSRSWELTQGNFWRIIGIGIGVFLPAVIVFGMAQTAILGPDYFLKAGAAAQGVTKTAAALARIQLMADNLPLITGIYAFLMPFLSALQNGPAAYAYRALTAAKAPPAA